MSILSVKIIEQVEDVAGRSLSIRTREFSLNTPAYAVDSRSAKYLNKSQLEIVEVGLAINITKYYIKLRKLDYDSILEHLSRRIDSNLTKKGNSM